MDRSCSNEEAESAEAMPLPWATPPTDLGDAICDWCGRAIYVPAVPCSVRPVVGLLAIDTGRGIGDRCKWELSTRTPLPAALTS
jgi:hypothetical protein